ncbi:MAG: hypothetical protein K0Q54_5248, partial [Methylobacterium brachiatum]|nr:hypothetical protein [Methylobacterium brachiatum]
EVLRAMAAELDAALVMEPDRAAVQASIAVLFDARVRGPQNPQIYLDALAFDLIDEGFPPAVVVAACQTLRREAVYMPEISEILAACRAKLSTYRAVANHAGRLAGIRAQLEARLGGMP